MHQFIAGNDECLDNKDSVQLGKNIFIMWQNLKAFYCDFNFGKVFKFCSRFLFEGQLVSYHPKIWISAVFHHLKSHKYRYELKVSHLSDIGLVGEFTHIFMFIWLKTSNPHWWYFFRT